MRTFSSTGFVKKQVAPSLSARARIASSGTAVMKMKGMRPQTEGAGPHGRSFRKVGRLKLNMSLLTCCPVKKNPDLSSDFAIWQSYCPSRQIDSNSGSRHVRSGSFTSFCGWASDFRSTATSRQPVVISQRCQTASLPQPSTNLVKCDPIPTGDAS